MARKHSVNVTYRVQPIKPSRPGQTRHPRCSDIAEDSVTIVRCLKCSHSGHLSLVGGRFWCAWCSDWSEVETKCLRDRTVTRGGAEPGLHAVSKPGYALQPLRVPDGWHVLYNGSLYEVDPSPESFPDDDRW